MARKTRTTQKAPRNTRTTRRAELEETEPDHHSTTAAGKTLRIDRATNELVVVEPKVTRSPKH